jgi:hypothetical protein
MIHVKNFRQKFSGPFILSIFIGGILIAAYKKQDKNKTREKYGNETILYVKA